jgi:hypothetical protein
MFVVLLSEGQLSAQNFTNDVDISRPDPQLWLSDTATGKVLTIKNHAGDLSLNSVIQGSSGFAPAAALSLFQQNVLVRNDGNVGIGSNSPSHRLRLKGGPAWTSSSWEGAIELENAAAIGWRANAKGRRFGIGHTNGGFYFFHTDSDPGKPTGAAHYDLVINDDASVSVNVLNILSGSDISERFHVVEGPGSSPPGSIEPRRPRRYEQRI